MQPLARRWKAHTLSADTPAPRRRGRFIAAALAVAAVALLTLGPRALVAPVSGAVIRIMDAATGPLLTWIGYDDAERLLNILLFVPLGVTLALVLGRRLRLVAALAGFAMSSVVEYAQRSIPGRVPDLEDVLWNTVGAAIGVIIVALAGRSGRKRMQ